LKIDPELRAIYPRLGTSLIDLGKPREAIDILQKGIELTPKVSENYCQLGQAYLQLNAFEQAKEHFQAAIALNPADARAYYGLAVVCARLGQTDESRRYREKFQTLKTRDYANWDRGGHVLDDVKLARENLSRTYTEAGQVYRKHGDAGKAEQYWLRAAALDALDVICRRALASLYEQAGRDEEALQICERLKEIDPKNAQYQVNSGVLYARLRRTGEALLAIKQAIRLDPENPEYPKLYDRILNSPR
jgi:tetratricopeptide (TPR) repeat protein